MRLFFENYVSLHNMKMKLNTYKPSSGERLLYILVWSMALLVPILHSKMMSEEHVYLVNIFTAWGKLFPYIFLFIVNDAVLAPKLLFRKRYFAYIATILSMLVVIFYGIEYYNESIRYVPYAGGDMYVIHGRASFTDLAWYWNVLLGVFLTSANCGIKMMFKSMEDEQKMATLERQNLQSEMDALKYQINPHFFMNTLNNIHALIDIDTEAAKTTVIELSKMMRYVLYDTENHVTDIRDDIRFIEHYIALMRIRYTEAVDVKFEIEGTIPMGAKVPPLLLIVFVENSFKHGVSYNKPSFVHIKLRCDNDRVYAEIRNSRHKTTSATPGGVGLENVKKRLDLIYGDRYKLVIDNSNDKEYIVNLSIPTIK